MDLTNEDVADILALLDSLPYDSLDVETPRFRLTLRRAADGEWTQESQVTASPAPVTAEAAGAGKAAGAGDAGTGRPAAGDGPWGTDRPVAGDASVAGDGSTASLDDGHREDVDADGLAVVAAPLPGTFYRAPRPGADPFVQVGDEVVADTVVAIVETMKLMNSVHAGTDGRVARVCVGNGEFAPLGATLMLIEPSP